MVGARTLMKLLHCRAKYAKCSNYSTKASSERKTDKSGGGTSGSVNNFNMFEDANNLCRVCLREGKIPIFGNDAEDIVDDLHTIGGIKVLIDDPYPKKICKACLALLQGAILFRKSAQKSDEVLKNSPKSTEPRNGISNDYDNNDEASNDPINSSVKITRIYSLMKTAHLKFDQDQGGDVGDFFNDNHNESITNLLKEEEVEVTKIKDIVKCNKCDIQFNSFEEYTDHRLTEEHENKKIECPICNKHYNSYYMKSHLARHKKEASFICDVCGRNFVLESQMNRHRLTHFYDLPFKCSLCPYRGRFTESLRLHMRSHTGEKPYQCAECPARFVTKSNLSKHMKTHIDQYDFSCEECGRSYYTKAELEQHIKVIHRGIKDHFCRICKKPFGSRKQMMKHERKVHKREALRSGKMPLYLQVESMKKQDMEATLET